MKNGVPAYSCVALNINIENKSAIANQNAFMNFMK